MPPMNCPQISGTAAATMSQKLKAFKRGKAISLAPIMIGMMKLPKGPVTMMIVPTIIKIPCVPTIEL